MMEKGKVKKDRYKSKIIAYTLKLSDIKERLDAIEKGVSEWFELL